MSRSADPLRILIVVAVTAAIGVKVLYSVYGEASAKTPRAVGTARLSGRVTNVDGAGLSGAMVRLYGGGQGFTATTDLGGRYTFSNLAAGEYYVYASNPGFLQTYYGEERHDVGMRSIPIADGAEVTTVDMRLPRGGSISGTVYDDKGKPARRKFMRIRHEDGTVPALPALAATDDDGRYRIAGLPPGRYVLLANFTTDGLWRVFYPNGESNADAALIELGAGENLTGVDLHARPRATAPITGQVRRAATLEPMSAMVRLIGDEVDLKFNVIATDEQGRFTFADVPPGSYYLVAQHGRDVEGRSPRDANTYSGLTQLTTDGRRAAETTIDIEPGFEIAGSVQFAPRKGSAAPAMSEVMIAALAADLRTRRLTASDLQLVKAGADGKFEMRGVPGGRYYLSATARGDDKTYWTPTSALMADGSPIANPIEIGPGHVTSGIAVTLVDAPNRLVGVVKTASDEPVADQMLVAFPADPASWPPNEPTVTPRFDDYHWRYSMTFSDSRGRYVFSGLVAGDYIVAPVDGLPRSTRVTRPLVEQLAQVGTRVSIAADGRTEADVVRPPSPVAVTARTAR
jgi:hypothetical protein